MASSRPHEPKEKKHLGGRRRRSVIRRTDSQRRQSQSGNKTFCCQSPACLRDGFEGFILSLLTLCHSNETKRPPQEPVAGNSGDSLDETQTAHAPTGPTNCQDEAQTAHVPTGPTKSKKPDVVDLWCGYLWKLNSNVCLSDKEESDKLRNWRLRRFVLSEYTDPETKKTSGVLSYMSEKLEGINRMDFSLKGKYQIDYSVDFPVVYTLIEANKTRLDNETYEVAFGEVAGSLQSESRKEGNVPNHFYAFKISAPAADADGAITEITLATTVPRDRRLWVDKLEQYMSGENRKALSRKASHISHFTDLSSGKKRHG